MLMLFVYLMLAIWLAGIAIVVFGALVGMTLLGLHWAWGSAISTVRQRELRRHAMARLRRDPDDWTLAVPPAPPFPRTTTPNRSTAA